MTIKNMSFAPSVSEVDISLFAACTCIQFLQLTVGTKCSIMVRESKDENSPYPQGEVTGVLNTVTHILMYKKL